MEALLDGDHQIVGLQVSQLQVCIAGDAEEVVTLHGHAWKQEAEVEGHHLFKGHCCVHGLWIRLAQVGGDGHKARQDFLRNLHPGQQALAAVGIDDQCRHIQAEVADEREGMGWIHRQRCQHREDGGEKEVVDPFALAPVQLGVIEQLNVVLVQLGFEMAAVVLLLLFQQRDQGGANGLQLLLRCASIGTGAADAGLHLRFQGGHPHHEKFIEVVAEDGAEFRLFQQRGALIEGLGQDPLVEANPAQFPVDVELGIQGTNGHQSS